MLIQCPSCSSQYKIADSYFGEKGRSVRCASCRHTWFVASHTENKHDFSPFSHEPEDIAFEEIAQEQPLAEHAFPPHKAVSSEIKKPKHTSKKPKAKRSSSGLLKGGFGAALGLVAIAGMMVGRETVVKAFPETAKLYASVGLPVNVRHVAFRQIVSRQIDVKGDISLIVEGEVHNLANQPVDLSLLEIALRDQTGQSLYSWTIEPPRSTLSGLESAKFRARLASPPQGSNDVMVRFATFEANAPRNKTAFR